MTYLGIFTTSLLGIQQFYHFLDFYTLICYIQSTLKVILANRTEIEIAYCVSYNRQISGYREQGEEFLNKELLLYFHAIFQEYTYT